MTLLLKICGLIKLRVQKPVFNWSQKTTWIKSELGCILIFTKLRDANEWLISPKAKDLHPVRMHSQISEITMDSKILSS